MQEISLVVSNDNKSCWDSIPFMFGVLLSLDLRHGSFNICVQLLRTDLWDAQMWIKAEEKQKGEPEVISVETKSEMQETWTVRVQSL